MLIERLNSDDPGSFFLIVIVVVISICLHELAHGIVAIWLGDDTPIATGHMTLNPLVHMGPFSILALLLMGIAWGQMPVDRSRLRGRYAEALVAAAGPFCNVLIAIVTLTALGLWFRFGNAASDQLSTTAVNARNLLETFGVFNVVLALFNLIPLPPLDGSRILANLSRWYDDKLNMLMGYGGGAVMMVTLVVFLTVGRFLFPLSNAIAIEYLRAVVRAFR
jgi:Zn-dependent protease